MRSATTDGQTERKKKGKRNWKRSVKKQCSNLSWRMIDSLLTLTDDHLREHKHLTPSACSSLNASLQALPFHLQTAGFYRSDFYSTGPETTSLFVGDLTLVLTAKEQTIRELCRRTSGLIVANSCVRCLRGEVIFCTGAQSNLLEGTWPGGQIQFHLERKSLWIKKSISRMTPGMNHFIRNGKYRGITTRWRSLRQYWGWQKKNLLKVTYHDYFLIFVSPSVESSGAAARNLLFPKGENKSMFSPLFPVWCASLHQFMQAGALPDHHTQTWWHRPWPAACCNRTRCTRPLSDITLKRTFSRSVREFKEVKNEQTCVISGQFADIQSPQRKHDANSKFLKNRPFNDCHHFIG